MDRSLDDVISDRQRASFRGSRDRRPYNAPRDGVRKSSQRDDSRNLDRDWVHDRYEEDHESRRRPARGYRNERSDRRSPEADLTQTGAKLRVDNLHYELTEDDLNELFSRIGHVNSVSLLYDRQDRSKGIAFVTYERLADARAAIRDYDGANAHGQPIRLTLLPTPQPRPARNPFDTAERPARSLFDRIESPAGRPGRRDRSASPDRRVRHSDVSKPAPEHIDRYVPGQGGRRSPPPRRGSGRELGRRPGARRDDSSRGARGRKDEEGRMLVQGRPRKTAEELDAEMADYWGKPGDAEEGGPVNKDAMLQNGGGGPTRGALENPAGTTAALGDDDIDMIE